MGSMCSKADRESYDYIDYIMKTSMGLPVKASYVHDVLYQWRRNNGVRKGILSRAQIKAFLGREYQTGYFNTETGKMLKLRPNHSHYVQMYWDCSGEVA